MFETMLEAKVLIELWRVTYNMMRPPRIQNVSARVYQPPAREITHPRKPGYVNSIHSLKNWCRLWVQVSLT